MTLLAELVRASARVAAEPGRLAKTGALAGFLKSLAPADVDIALPYLSGEARQGKLSLGHSTLAAARVPAADLPALTLKDVDAAFSALKGLKGKGSAARRETILRSLMARATPDEQDFLFRLGVGELRQGALEGVMVEAVASAAGLPADALRRAATFAGALAPVARVALEEGAAGLARFSIRVMQPVMPMLAQPAADTVAALAALPDPLIEWKLDGARIQAHKDGAEVRVYTRTLKEVTAAVPEVVEAVRAAPAASLILDGEVIALRPDGRPRAFQDTMRRFGRKLDDPVLRRDLPLSAFFFDCLLVDGRPMVDAPLRERRAALERAVSSANVVPAQATREVAEAEAFYAAALAKGHEGMMAKGLDSTYEAGRRGAAWMKVKKAHTLDLVVLAAEWGSGRRKGWLSNLHLGARDPKGGFVMLGKTFKGLTDALLEWQTRELLGREARRDEWTVHVRPELVVEIEFNDIQQSPHYPGGLALRFARVKRYRDDKEATEADTIDAVRAIFEAQR